MPLSNITYQKIDRELTKYPATQKQSAVIAALAIAQDEAGWISPEVMQDVADYLQMPTIAVQEVATFYNMFHTQPIGHFKVTLCTNLPCVLSGADRAAKHLQDRLQLEFGKTSTDNMFTLQEGECLGACGDAPVLLVNNKKMCSFMSPAKIDELINELRASQIHTQAVAK